MKYLYEYQKPKYITGHPENELSFMMLGFVLHSNEDRVYEYYFLDNFVQFSPGSEWEARKDWIIISPI